MAENKETIVLEINASDALSQIANMQKELDMLREAQKQFTTDSVEYQKMASAIRIVSKEQSDLKRTLDASVKARQQELDTVNFGNNSIKQNRELLKQLTAQYVDMKTPLPALTNQIKALSDKLKEQEAAIGDTRRNVGNYAGGFKDAFKEIASGIPGMDKFANAQKGINAVMSANPIGGVVTLLFALKDILGQNAEFADMFEFALAAVNKVFQSAVDLIAEGVQSLGFLKNAFSDPIGTIKQLGQMLADNLINRFKALGGFVEAISLAFQGQWAKAAETATNAALQLGTGVQGLGDRFATAAKEGYNASKALDELVVTSAKTKAAISQSRIEVEALTKSLKDRTKTEQERIAIANKIADKEIQSAELTRKLAAEVLAAEQMKLKGKKLSAEEEARLIELDQEVKNAAAEAEVTRAQRQTRINILLEKEAKSTSKSVVDSTKDQVKAAEEAAKRLDEIDKAVSKARSEEFAKLFESNQIDIYGNKIVSEAAATKDELAAISEESNAALENDLVKQEILFKTRQYLRENDLRDAKTKATEQQAINEAVFNSSSQLVNALAQISTVALGNSAAGVAFQKVLAGVQIAIDTATAISSIVTGIMKVVGTNPSPLAIFQVVAQVATGIAVVTTNMMKATQLLSGANTPEAPEMQTFAEGGRVYTLGGKRHSEGGTKFHGSDGTRFEAERGEKIFVMKRTASSAIDRLGSFNQLYGGRPWSSTRHANAEDGGLVFDGGMTSRSFNQPNITEQLRNALTNMPPAVVSVKEINTVNTRRTIAQEQAGL